MSDNSPGRLAGLFRRFPKVYWVVLSFELMERGAYYSMMPILVVHFFWNVGLPQELTILLTVFMYPFQYAMPIVTSALAEKVGYKRQMIFGFSILAVAYVFLSIAYNAPTAILGMMLIGFGIGCYKPLVSSTIAKATVQKDRNVAYSVYYWIVNFAATFFALTWGLLMLFEILPNSAFAWIFRISAIYFLVNIVVAIFIFEEVPRSGAVRTLKDVGTNIATAFKDKKFVVMMLLIAGFWALYSTTLAPFIMIMYGYRFIPIWIPVILLGVVNPGTIILLGGPLSKYAEKIESIKLLMGGVFIYLVGLGLITFFLEVLPVVIIGMIIYSIGEFMVAPGYLSFVSKLAPKEKVSAYIGCNFLASFTGIFGGALILGLIASIVAVDMARPHFYFGLLMGFGLIILILFMVYNRVWGKDIINRAKQIEMDETDIGEEEFDARKLKKEPFLFKMFDFKMTMLISAILIPIILISTFAFGTNNFHPPEEDEPEPFIVIYEEQSITLVNTGETNAPNSEDYAFDDPGNATWITVRLTWTDENVRTPLQNEPDTFSIALMDLDGTTELDRAEGSGGSLEFRVNVTKTIVEDQDEEEVQESGQFTVIITCEETGNIFGPLGIFQRQVDPGNTWDLSVTIDYLEEKRIDNPDE